MATKPDTRQYDADDDTAVLDGIVQLSFAVQGILQRAAAAHDLSLTQFRLLGILRDRHPTMAALAAHLKLDRSSVSGLIDRAERRELVRREIAAHDKRVIQVAITGYGLQLAEELVVEVTPPLRALLAGLPPVQRTALGALLGTVVDTLDPEVTTNLA